MPSLLVESAAPSAAQAAVALSRADRRLLLRVARTALAVATRSKPAVALADVLKLAGAREVGGMRSAAFVTLMVDGDLRGCMGALEPLRPLPQAVADACLLAAREDPRFWPVQPSELPALRIEVSVLSPMTPIADPDRMRPGVDGVLVERAGRRALLLPQVATEQDWDAHEMWRAACHKAGLPEDAWRSPETRLSVFQAVHFGGAAVVGGAEVMDAARQPGSLPRASGR